MSVAKTNVVPDALSCINAEDKDAASTAEDNAAMPALTEETVDIASITTLPCAACNLAEATSESSSEAEEMESPARSEGGEPSLHHPALECAICWA